MNGVMLAVVARNGIRRSNLLTSMDEARSSERSRESKLLRVGRSGGPFGWSGPFKVSGFRSCAFSSTYPDWKTPVSGLCTSDAQTDCTSENLLLFRKTSRKVVVCESALRNCQILKRMTAQETIEKTARIRSTIFAGADDRKISPTILPKPPSGASPLCTCSKARARARDP